VNYREAARKLSTLGCTEIQRRSGGSHRKWTNAAIGRGAVLPDWGSKDLKMGTVRSTVRKLGIAWQDFLNA